jgi:hypothetical protein
LYGCWLRSWHRRRRSKISSITAPVPKRPGVGAGSYSDSSSVGLRPGCSFCRTFPCFAGLKALSSSATTGSGELIIRWSKVLNQSGSITIESKSWARAVTESFGPEICSKLPSVTTRAVVPIPFTAVRRGCGECFKGTSKCETLRASRWRTCGCAFDRGNVHRVGP